MTMTAGAWLSDQPATQAFLTDLTSRRIYALDGIRNALGRLGDLAEAPAHAWMPDTDTATQRMEEGRALLDMYARGTTAVALVADATLGTPVFCTQLPLEGPGRGMEFVRQEDVTAGLLGQAMAALFAARRIFSYVYTTRWFYRATDGGRPMGPDSEHAEMLFALEQTIMGAMSWRLKGEDR